MRRLPATLRRHGGLLANSSLLAVGSALSAALGFVYWWLAARWFAPAVVGTGSAAISGMAFVAMSAQIGFGTLLLGEAGARTRQSNALVVAALLAGSLSSLVIAIPIAALLCHERWMTPTDTGLFVLGCVLTAFSLVIDNALVGVGQSRLQFARSLTFSVMKLLLLIGMGLVTRSASVILVTWVVSLCVSLAVCCGLSRARRVLPLVAPDVGGLWQKMPLVIDHSALNIAAAGPVLVMPVVVSACLSPTVNAAYFAGWMIWSIAMLVPASLTTVLFSLDRSAPEAIGPQLRFSLNLSLLAAAAGSVGFWLLGDLMLWTFSPAYPALAGAAMPFMGIGLIGGAIRHHYVLLARMRRRMRRGALWLGLSGCAEIALAALGGRYGDVRWLTLGWVAALTVSSALLLRPLLQVRHAPVAPAASAPRRDAFVLRTPRSLQHEEVLR